MLNKEHEDMVSLKKEKKETKMEEYKPPLYPTLRIGKDIGLTDKDLKKTKVATIEFKATEVTERVENGVKTHSVEMEIMGINIH